MNDEQLGVMQKSGTWYSHEGVKLAQGRDKVMTHLVENPDLARRLRELTLARARDSLGLVPLTPPTDAAAGNGVPRPQNGAAERRPEDGPDAGRHAHRDGDPRITRVEIEDTPEEGAEAGADLGGRPLASARSA